MAGILYIKQREEKLGLVLDPDEFKTILRNAESSLASLFDQLYAEINLHNKSHMTNTKTNSVWSRLNNKFINGTKAEIGYMLDSAGISALAIETFTGAGINIRQETVGNETQKETGIDSYWTFV